MFLQIFINFKQLNGNENVDKLSITEFLEKYLFYIQNNTKAIR